VTPEEYFAQEIKKLGVDEQCTCSPVMFESGYIDMNYSEDCITHPEEAAEAKEKRLARERHVETVYRRIEPIESYYVSALTRHDKSATVIDGMRLPILPEDFGTVHAVRDPLRTIYRREDIHSNRPSRHDAYFDREKSAAKNDFRELWKSRQPLFYQNSRIDFHISECGLSMKVLLAMDFAEDDPDSCPRCATEIYKQAQRTEEYLEELAQEDQD